MNKTQKIFLITAEQAGERVDSFLAKMLSLSRNQVQKLLDSSLVHVSAQPVGKNYRLELGDTIEVSFFHKIPPKLAPENLPLSILYEDANLVVVNKPKGMLTHPTEKTTQGTLVNALLYHFPNSLSDSAGENRPGIVHRLDRETSGVLIVAKNNRTHEQLNSLMLEQRIVRKYKLIVRGRVESPTGVIDVPLRRHPVARTKMIAALGDESARMAQTRYQVLEYYRDYSLIEAELITGRTHQIRVHFQQIGHMIVGDMLYGQASLNAKFPWLQGQCLHSFHLSFVLPATGKEISVESVLPDYFLKTIDFIS